MTNRLNFILGGHIENSVNELSSIIEKQEDLHKWQEIVPQTHAAPLQENKNIEDRNREDKKLKLVIFGENITELVASKIAIKCDEYRARNLSQSGAKVIDIPNQIEHFKNKHRDSKAEKIIMYLLIPIIFKKRALLMFPGKFASYYQK